MRKHCRIRQGAFGRWYIFHAIFDFAAWSGSRWAPCLGNGLPAADVQTSNFDTREAALACATSQGFDVDRELAS
jgi:hypothetical protein